MGGRAHRGRPYHPSLSIVRGIAWPRLPCGRLASCPLCSSILCSGMRGRASRVGKGSIMKYRIVANGIYMGTYTAESAEGALDAYARDAGYSDFSALCDTIPGAEDDDIDIEGYAAVYDEMEKKMNTDEVIAKNMLEKYKTKNIAIEMAFLHSMEHPNDSTWKFRWENVILEIKKLTKER